VSASASVARLFAEGTALLFGALFLIAAFGKLDDWSGWCDTVKAGLGETGRADFLAYSLPLVEVGVAVWGYRSPRTGLLACAALSTILAVGVVRFTKSAGSVSCSCFGALGSGPLTRRLAWRNGVFAIIAAGGAGAAAASPASSPGLGAAALAALLVLTGGVVAEFLIAPRRSTLTTGGHW
jgi:hypothetical protein